MRRKGVKALEQLRSSPLLTRPWLCTALHCTATPLSFVRLSSVSFCCRYEFRYVEENRHVRKGERVWQLGFGSGFKCNSAVWRKL